MKWQRIARLVIALTALGFVVAVAVSFRARPSPQTESPVATSDPKAVLESQGGQTFRVNKEQEEFAVSYEKTVTYADGASKMLGVTIVTERSGRTYTIKAKEGQSSDKESILELQGDVKIESSDGLTLTTDRATYTQTDGLTRAPGAAQFTRGRMSGSGLGFTYDKNNDILTIANETLVHVRPENGQGEMHVSSGAFEYRRNEKTLRFERAAKATRDGQIVEAQVIVAHLTPDEDHLQSMELRTESRITAAEPMPNGLQAMTGQDMDLTYAADGTSLEHALISVDAVLQIAGEARRPGRQIAARTIDLLLAADGSTLAGLTAREAVKLTLPADETGIARTISAQNLDGRTESGRGLTGARFTGGVQFTERGAKVDRVVRSANLDIAVSSGFATIDDARFTGTVRFTDGALSATAAQVRYDVDRGQIALSGSEPASLVPHIVNEQIAVDGSSIDVTLEGPVVKATGAVKSVLRSKPADKRTSDDVRLPSMLKSEQPVNVTADSLNYNGATSRAEYAGGALLWQGDTQIKAPEITIDGKQGDLAASGQVATVALMSERNKDGQVEPVRSIGTAKTFSYVDATRLATYLGEAHMRGPQGDLTSEKIELFLKPSGDELDRVEGYDGVTLRADDRKSTGKRLTYFGDEGRYLVVGTPVTIVDACGRETAGGTLTFFKSTDRIIVDGGEQVRTQTRGKSNCPGT